ncbi:hypothetical protein DID88_007023 [Monilinia fructigena]|uniref:CCHC-type domain-containing protein n=1 Tax=Monilinia fructigena TaxID=38457 RepID=A0A395J9I0_9HELO|nr:hypothetical protein DID88_006634 [Monilinia fructigena]RAL59222.1 hypothetical protein DID88_006677 [Monilinia fructigena]RAL60504.1 hypothetical protein DID88_009700 [Monilinia fructigena]RAL60703.1 hypothetical protein DID88_010021 [Monilinia fructigena]RAL61601.1 hypothetical protein DID88_009639 [Monilinia fructigena]
MEGNAPPQWLQDMFGRQAQQAEQQAQQMMNLTLQQAETIARLESRMALYETSRQETPTSPEIPIATPPMLDNAVRKPKPSLPHPEKFDGSELTYFPQFEGLLRAKLEIDGPAIGQEKERVWYAFGRLSGEAAARIFPWIAYANKEEKFTVEEFMGQLRTAFSDPRQQQKALSQINRTKQGTRPFSEFLNEFNRLILEAEGWGWADAIKKGYLKAALNTKLLTATIGVPEEASYDAYCKQLLMINDQLNEIAELTTWRTKKKSGPFAEVAQSSTMPAPSYDTMDWQPTIAVSSARTKEPRWASDEVIEVRRRSGLCLRCGLDGHRVRECHTKVKFQKKKVRAASMRKMEAPSKVERTKELSSESIDRVEELSDSEDSGKE